MMQHYTTFIREHLSPTRILHFVKKLIKATLVNGLLFTITLVITLLLAEGVFYGLNTFYPVEKTEIATFDSIPNQERLDFFQYHSVYGYAGIPNVDKTFHGKTITHNAKGLRGKEYSYEKPENTQRIAFIGDSQTWGWAVKNDETIPEFTQLVLSEINRDQPVEVLNFGATGYGVDQSYLRLISEGLHYQPDTVVLTYFSDNDIWETTSVKAWGVEKPYMYEKEDGKFCVSNVPPRRASGWPADNIGFILENRLNFSVPKVQFSAVTIDLSETHIARYFKDRNLTGPLLTMLGMTNGNPIAAIEQHLGCLEQEPGPVLTDWNERVLRTLNIIVLIRDTVEAAGGKFIVIAKPLEKDYKANAISRDYASIVNGLSDAKVDVVELFTEAKMVELQAESMYLAAGHLSPQGNYLAARKLAERITGKPDEPTLAGE